MLVQLVRPLVRSQIQMLARTPAADSKLTNMVAQWLGYLGVYAEVTRLETEGELIQVSLKVGRPEQCTETEWQSILDNLTHKGTAWREDTGLTYATMTPAQKGKVHRLLACVLQASNDNLVEDWDRVTGELAQLGLEASLLNELRSAIRVPTPMEVLIEDLQPDVAAFALSKAIGIALMDKHINEAEDGALKILLTALQQETRS
ncbi:MAG: hypothetical protein AAF773_05960 [Cyanobacteria bacterium P01_D01_bin.115]